MVPGSVQSSCLFFSRTAEQEQRKAYENVFNGSRHGADDFDTDYTNQLRKISASTYVKRSSSSLSKGGSSPSAPHPQLTSPGQYPPTPLSHQSVPEHQTAPQHQTASHATHLSQPPTQISHTAPGMMNSSAKLNSHKPQSVSLTVGDTCQPNLGVA